MSARKWIGITLGVLITLGVIAEVAIHRANPILKKRVIETLSTRFESRVDLDTFDVSVLRGLEVTGGGLRIYPPEQVVRAGADQPLIAIQQFSFHSGFMGLFVSPTHVRTVYVSGLQIHIPPKEMRQETPDSGKRKQEKLKVVVDTIICENSRLVIGTSKPDKDPRDFELRHIEMHDVGPNAPWQYDATLTNAIPRGDIHATGTFGPWQTESPGDSTVTGHYTFRNADLNTIKGISGILSSVGDFQGQLDRIEVTGTTDTPDFSLDTANQPMPLHTEFHALVDGTSGDTYLQPVKARLKDSDITCKGSVVSVKGKGHAIDLDVDVPAGRLQDFLNLAVKTRPPVMTATLGTKTKLHIRPGEDRVAEKLSFRGDFTLQRIHFTNSEVQDKVDMLSLRAQGHPKEAKQGADDVRSRMRGRFAMRNGVIRFSNLVYDMPGASVRLAGEYSLDGSRFDFEGKVRTKATISQMVASRWKSFLLKSISPFFKKNGAGAEIPVKITGTKSEPKFGLNLFH